jgi:predicted RNA binding protein YcfA (HicA-like mRNA interferase family)
MPKLPKIKGKELIKILAVHGFQVIRIKGSHHFISPSFAWATGNPHKT